MTPFFLPGPSGDIFITQYSAIRNDSGAPWVLHFPAFAEEMNKSRPMVSLMARKWAAAGYHVLVPDLYGTGDSEGEFADASWQKWQADMQFLMEWISDKGGGSVIFWGLRSGCLLAADLIRSLPESHQQRIEKFVFWQPVLKGEQFVTQFLRLRVASSMMSGEKETVSSLRRQLAEQGALEVAGYSLSTNLITPMDKMLLSTPAALSAITCDWFEIASSAERPLSVTARNTIEHWQKQGVDVTSKVVEGNTFWATQEVAMAPALLEATLNDASGATPEAELPTEQKAVFVQNDFAEQPVIFDCEGSQLAGVIHHAGQKNSRGVVLVVGGPQYRVGSHRQFVSLARALSMVGIPVLRFDYRGMGDSEGDFVGFENIDRDIAAAVDCLQRECSVDDVVLWGLCDAATAVSFYAPTDTRVKGLVLLNPWVRSEQGEAKAYLKHYYLQRLVSKDFWRKVATGDFSLRGSAKSLIVKLKAAFNNENTLGVGKTEESLALSEQLQPLSDRMYETLSHYKGKGLIILSGNDLTAAEYEDSLKKHKQLRKLIGGSQFLTRRINEADHTFSRASWKRDVELMTKEWIQSW